MEQLCALHALVQKCDIGQAYLSSSAAVQQLFREVLHEPGVGADAPNRDAVARVGLEDLADEVHALPGQMQVAGEAVLHAHDALQGRTYPSDTAIA